VELFSLLILAQLQLYLWCAIAPIPVVVVFVLSRLKRAERKKGAIDEPAIWTPSKCKVVAVVSKSLKNVGLPPSIPGVRTETNSIENTHKKPPPSS
jgi:hypothetical protein